MTYLISRNGQQYGPYSDAEVRHYLTTGNILVTDYAQPEGSTEWALVGAIFAAWIVQTPGIPSAGAYAGAPVFAAGTPVSPASPVASATPHAGPGVPGGEAFPSGAGAIPSTGQPAYYPTASNPPARLYPDPPDLPWWLALILGLVTFGFFFVVWDIVESAWLRRVERGTSALLLYVAVAVLYLIRLPGSWATVRYNLGGDSTIYYSHAPGLGLAALILIIVARFVFRRELLTHFNGPEPLNLHLNAFWTLLFGGLYFQFKFNRINRRKRELQVSIPS